MPRLSHSRRAAVRAVRTLGAVVAAASLAALLTITVGSPKAHADTGSALTIAWLNDASSASSLQPQRPTDDTSGKLTDFSKLRVTVSQTRDLIDQAVDITVSGMAPTAGLGHAAQNYLQVMQCWGDPQKPADENPADCAFGAWDNTGFDPSLTNGSTGLQGEGAGFNAYERPDSVPFTSVTGQTSKVTGPLDGLERFFTTSTGNEQDLVPIFAGPDGNETTFAFHAQSGITAPWLGCGDTSITTVSDPTSCYLVIIPRGTHSGALKGADPSSCAGNGSVTDGGYGSVTLPEVGSPLSPSCSFWNDRIVVPLTFAPIATSCPVTGTTLNVAGSQLMQPAVSSWENSICKQQGGANLAFTSNPGSLVRTQLLEGQQRQVLVGEPVTEADVGDGDDPSEFTDADIRYAPVANAALSIGFLVESTTEPHQINLTPRLVAKLLTQSYREEVPTSGSNYTVPYLPNNPLCIVQDPEFIAVNQSDIGQLEPLCAADSASLITTANGDDAIQLLWQWIDSDAAAVKWLQGTPDENGMVVNPYYLPATNPKAKKGGLATTDLATGVDSMTGPVNQFFRADQTSFPAQDAPPSDAAPPTFDSFALNPFSDTFGQVATRVLNGDSQTGSIEIALGSNPPALAKALPQLPAPQKALLGVTDQADADQFALDAASLQLPDTDPADPDNFVAPTEQSMQTAVNAEVQSTATNPADGMATVNLKDLPQGAYPLTTTIYAAMNINDSTLDPDTRNEFAVELEYMATNGQVPGTARGELPPGYVPLDAAQEEQSLELALILRGKLDPNVPVPPGTNPSTPSSGGGAPGGGGSGGIPNTDQVPSGDVPSGSTEPGATDGIATSTLSGNGGVDNVAAVTTAQKQPASKTGVGQAALGGSLGVGVAGMVAAPFLMRRRVIKP